MGFKEAVRTVLKQKYRTFSGRACRSEFWWFQLFFLLTLTAFGFVIGFLAALGHKGGGFPLPATIITVLAGIFYLGMLLPLIAATVRRFHDRNLSGWWYLGIFLAGLIPYVNFVTGIATIVILVLPGTKGPNKFGTDPLNPTAVAEVFA